MNPLIWLKLDAVGLEVEATEGVMPFTILVELGEVGVDDCVEIAERVVDAKALEREDGDSDSEFELITEPETGLEADTLMETEAEAEVLIEDKTEADAEVDCELDVETMFEIAAEVVEDAEKEVELEGKIETKGDKVLVNDSDDDNVLSADGVADGVGDNWVADADSEGVGVVNDNVAVKDGVPVREVEAVGEVVRVKLLVTVAEGLENGELVGEPDWMIETDREELLEAILETDIVDVAVNELVALEEGLREGSTQSSLFVIVSVSEVTHSQTHSRTRDSSQTRDSYIVVVLSNCSQEGKWSLLEKLH